MKQQVTLVLELSVNEAGALTGPVADSLKRVEDFVGLQCHLGQADLVLIDVWLDLGFYLRLGDMVDGKVQSDAGQGAGPRRVAFGNGEAVETAALRAGSAQEHHYVLASQPVHEVLDLFLTVQVKGTRRGSNEAVGRLQHHLRPGAHSALGDGISRDPIPFAEGDDFHVFQIHALLPLTRALAGGRRP